MQVQTFLDRKASLFMSALLICHFAVSTLCLTEIAVLDKVAPLLEVCQTVIVARGRQHHLIDRLMCWCSALAVCS